MFIRVSVFTTPEHQHIDDRINYQPFDVANEYAVMNRYKRGEEDKKYNFETKFVTLNTLHIVSIIPVKYRHYEDSWDPKFEGSLIIDTNNNQYLSPVPNLDKSVMELETQRVDIFTFDKK